MPERAGLRVPLLLRSNWSKFCTSTVNFRRWSQDSSLAGLLRDQIMGSVFDDTGGNSTIDAASIAIAKKSQKHDFHFLWIQCRWLVLLNGLLVAAIVLNGLFAAQKKGSRRRSPDVVKWKALIRTAPLSLLFIITAFLIQHWTQISSSIEEATKLSPHVTYTWH